jgi:prepilin-type N-terminal cleavage/methylation domain-containing protein
MRITVSCQVRDSNHENAPGSRGFTLIELAFALVIVGILITMGTSLLPMLTKQNKLSENKIIIREVKTAIMGYVLATGKLPYAAASTNGNPTANRHRGYLPYATLGTRRYDAYGRPLYYAVDAELARSTDMTYLTAHLDTLIATPASRTYSPALYCRSYPSGSANTPVAFVVLSYGANRAINTPNNVNNGSTTPFEAPEAPEGTSANYDDNLAAVSLTSLRGSLP